MAESQTVDGNRRSKGAINFEAALLLPGGATSSQQWKKAVANVKAHDMPPIEIKIPEGDKRSEYMQVMCDLNVLAFQTDTTRVSTYIGSTPNGVSYPELGLTDRHDSNTHHNFESEKVRKRFGKWRRLPSSTSPSSLTW